LVKSKVFIVEEVFVKPDLKNIIVFKLIIKEIKNAE